VDCKVERYAFHIPEKGTMVNEEVEVNVEDQTEVIRVPKHNDVAASQVMHDFSSRLSALRVPSTQDCYVSKLDPSLPSPQDMKLAMDHASQQPLPDNVRVEKTRMRELGFANRLALPQKILDFCGSFPIYNVEAIPWNSTITSLNQDQGQGRKKRNHEQVDYHMCTHAEKKKLADCHKKFGFNFGLTCNYTTALCYYIANCKHVGPTTSRKFRCDGVDHKYQYTGFCCWTNC